MSMIKFPTRNRRTPATATCPAWCTNPDRDQHACYGEQATHIEYDPDNEPEFAVTIRVVQLVGPAMIDLRAWQAGGEDESPSEIEQVLTLSEARHLAGLLNSAIRDAEGSEAGSAS